MKFNGVTYYKLSDPLYGEDKVKNCSLTASEIDWNFNFLRGNDVKDAFLDGDTANIHIEKENGEQIVITGLKDYLDAEYAKLDVDIDLSGTTYAPETGVMNVVVNGVEVQLTGFTIPSDFTVKTEYGLKGNGTDESPLRLDLFTETGFYAPVESLIDLTNGEQLPTDEEEKSACKKYLTKEYVPLEGLEYKYSAVRKIAEMLEKEGKGWRIANLEDWDGMLEAVECEEEHTPHDTHVEGSENGMVAGNSLKIEKDGWSGGFCDGYAFSVRPTDVGANGLEETTFWTTDQHEDGGIHAKKFHAEVGTVQHRIENTDANNLHSIRLVNDNENLECTQVICGVPYNVVKMESASGDTLAWTASNGYFSEFLATGEARIPEINTSGTPRYFLNEWDPYEKVWVKHEVEDDYLVVIKDYDNEQDVEVMVKDGELVKRNDAILNDVVKPVTDVLDNKISGLTDDLSALDARVGTIEGNLTGLTEEVANNKTQADANFAQITSTMNDNATIIERRLDGVDGRLDGIESGMAELREDIDANTEAIVSGDTALGQRIDDLSASADERINALSQNIGAVHDELDAKIDSGVTMLEGQIASGDEAVREELETERQERISGDTELEQAIVDAKELVQTELRASIDGVNSAISGVSERVTALETATAATASAISSIQEDTNDLQHQIDIIASQIDGGSGPESGIVGRIASLEDRMDDAESGITANRNAIGQANAEIERVEGKFDDEIDRIDGKLGELDCFTGTTNEHFLDVENTVRALSTRINGFDNLYVHQVTGMGLSSNDYTSSDKSKLGRIEDNAQVNVLEVVKVNGETLPITNKTVNIEVPTDYVNERTYETDMNAMDRRVENLEQSTAVSASGMSTMNQRLTSLEQATATTASGMASMAQHISDLESASTAGDTQLKHDIDMLRVLLYGDADQVVETFTGSTVQKHIEDIESAMTTSTAEIESLQSTVESLKRILKPVCVEPTVKLSTNIEKNAYPNEETIPGVTYRLVLTPNTFRYVNGTEEMVPTVIDYDVYVGESDDDWKTGSTITVSGKTTVSVPIGPLVAREDKPIIPRVVISYSGQTVEEPISGDDMSFVGNTQEVKLEPVVGYYPVYFKTDQFTEAEYRDYTSGHTIEDINTYASDNTAMKPERIIVNESGVNTTLILFPVSTLDTPIKKMIDTETGLDWVDDFNRKSLSVNGVPYYLYSYRTAIPSEDDGQKTFRIIY